jgi:hypothetical protein
MKVLAALLPTASGLISLLVNNGFKDSEISEIYAGAARYLSLRERAIHVSLNPDTDAERLYEALKELQEQYSELDLHSQRYLAGAGFDGPSYPREKRKGRRR